MPKRWKVRGTSLLRRLAVEDEDGNPVATVYGHPVEETAALVAAAPAMLEALEFLVEPFDGETDVSQSIASARAAIARARGEG